MGKSALHLHIRAAFPRAQQSVQIVPRHANAAHARIDFEMRQRARMPCAGEFLGLGERLGIEHRKRNAPGDHIFQKLPIRRAQHQHRRLDAVFPQFQRLFRRGHGKARRARAQAGARHRDGAMPIRVGFHHGHHRRVGLLRNLAQICGNGRGGNGQFGRSHSSRTCSCVSNVTLCARNRRSAASRSVTRKITSAWLPEERTNEYT